MKTNLLLASGLLALSTGCGKSSGDGNLAAAANVKLSSTARFDYVSGGTITYYSMLPTGLPDTDNPLGSCVTDSNGTCSVDLTSEQLTSVTAVVAELVGGTYVEESGGTSVEITTPIRTILPVDSSQLSGPNITLSLAITPYSNMAAQDAMNKAFANVVSAGIAAGKIPSKFADIDPMTSTDPEFLAAIQNFLNSGAGFDPTLMDAAVRFANDSIQQLSSQIGLPNVASTLPNDETYASLLRSLSEAAAGNQVSSMDMGFALGAEFGKSGKLPDSMSAITVTTPEGKTITITPPVFNDDGSVTLQGPDGTTRTLRPPVMNDDGSMTITDPDGNDVTLPGPDSMPGFPPSFPGSGTMPFPPF